MDKDDIEARLDKIKARYAMATVGPWHACGDRSDEVGKKLLEAGKGVPGLRSDGELCKCGMVWCDDFPVAEVTGGKWGDTYPALRIKGNPGSVCGELHVEAYNELAEYGEVSHTLQSANMAFIAASRSDVPWLVGLVETLMEEAKKQRD